MNNHRDQYLTGSAAAPWMEDLLAFIHLPPDFDQRCRLARQAAYAIDKMRRERSFHKLAPLPFDRYVIGLAGLAGVSLEPVLSSFGLAGFDQLTVATAKSFGRLASLLDLTLDQVKTALRWTFLGSVNPEGAGSVLAAHRGAQTNEGLEDDLIQWEKEYSNEVQAELDGILRTIENEYLHMG